jgi:CheY-like chemotaxis protein
MLRPRHLILPRGFTELPRSGGANSPQPSQGRKRRGRRSQSELDAMKESVKSKNYRMLFVDDDKAFREATARWLRLEFGLDVVEAGSGREALQKVEQDDPYDFIFLDLMMPPGIDGVETYLNLMNFKPAARVVMMSAFSNSDLWNRAVALGLKPLHKPLTEVMDYLIEIFGGGGEQG